MEKQEERLAVLHEGSFFNAYYVHAAYEQRITEYNCAYYEEQSCAPIEPDLMV